MESEITKDNWLVYRSSMIRWMDEVEESLDLEDIEAMPRCPVCGSHRVIMSLEMSACVDCCHTSGGDD